MQYRLVIHPPAWRESPCWPCFQSEPALRRRGSKAKTAGVAGADPGGVKHGDEGCYELVGEQVSGPVSAQPPDEMAHRRGGTEAADGWI